MDFIVLFWGIIKLVLLFATGLMAYLVNEFLVIPYFIRSKYRKYKNVAQSEDFQFMKGDLVDVERNTLQNKYRYWHYAEASAQKDHPDIYIKFLGNKPMYLMFSVQAVAEMNKLQPTKIDRDEYFLNLFIGKIFRNSFAQKLSDNNWKDRRNTSMKTLGINFASRYIQTLIGILDEEVKTWKVGSEFDFTTTFSSILFLFTCKTLFGNDVNIKQKKLKYKNSNGEFEEVTMETMIQKLAMDYYMGLMRPICTIFPFLITNDLVEPFKRSIENVRELERILKEYLSESKDDNSFYAKMKATGRFTEEEMVGDLLLMLFAGTDTTSHATVSLVYFLKKFPQCAQKCMKEYERLGIITNEGIQREKVTIKMFEETEYTEYFIKEVFRLDHTAPETVSYKTLENVEICGVPIQKDNMVSISLSGPHFDPNEWHRPLEFIPERFDPESEYFTAPSTGKSRSPLSFMPFSAGMRACPGQTMARLVQKITLPYFLSMIDYEISKDVLENDQALFNNTSQFHLNITIKGKMI
jgi:cytochrome P450